MLRPGALTGVRMQLVGDLDPQLIVDHQFFLFCGGLKPVYSDATLSTRR
jgi:hypothetical protein